jgi:hypothetical protein
MSIIDNLFSKQIQRAVRKQLAVIENENTFLIGTRSASQSDRDRFSYDRNDILEQSLEAWRSNPLARRIVELTSQYVVGGGLEISCKHKPTAKFIDSFWNHRLNHIPIRLFEMCDELTRTGNLFLLLSTDPAGMSFVRVIPTQNIDEIISAPNDIEQPQKFILKATYDDLQAKEYPSYDQNQDDPTKAVILQYAVNRPAGAQWGEPDLAPLLRWLSRYSNWLEDRARLNRYRNAFLFVVSAKFASEAQRIARQKALNANPPPPGSILVTDENEVWSIIAPKLESREAAADGLSLKKMIASGAGIPMHFLAEPESSTRTTAEAAGGPTYRHYEQRQEYFLWLIEDLIHVVVSRRALLDSTIKPSTEIKLIGADISSRDNISLAMAAGNILPVLMELRDRQLIDDPEFLRLVYRFTGETIDVEDMLEKGKAASKIITPIKPGDNGGSVHSMPTDAEGNPIGDPVPDPHKIPRIKSSA